MSHIQRSKNIQHSPSKYVFYSTGEFRNAFLKTIRQIIRESVRNMNIPPLTATSASTSGGAAAGATMMSRLPGGKPAPPLRSEATRLLGGHPGARGPGQQQQDATMTLQLRGKRQQPHQVGNEAILNLEDAHRQIGSSEILNFDGSFTTSFN